MLAAPSTPQRQLQPFLMSASPAGPSSQAGDDDDENGEDNVFRDMSFEEILEDLNARFLANLPEEEMTLVRLYWQAEQAHWFYEDYLRPLNPLLPSLSQRQFTHLIIASSPLYDGAGIDYDAVWEEYCAYKKMVPCCGGILINATNDKVLMVRGWKTNAGWCFPRGKINSEESEVACAIREVEEETGFDLSGRISANDFIKTQINAQEVTMFIVPNIDESTVFETQTRKEIGAIEWVPFHDLPTWSHKKGPKRTGGSGQKKFYNVTPFVGPLKKWLTNHGINPYPKRRVEAVPATRQRELQPFTFDDEPSLPATTSHASHAGHQHPTTALDHLFAKFIQKDESATNTESDNAKTLDQLFGGLMQQQPPKQQQTQQQQQAAAAQAEQASEDDALARLLGGLTTAAPPPPPPAQVLPDKQSKLLAVLSAPQNAPSAPVSAAAPAAPIPTVVQPQTPVRSYHQTNLLSMLSPPKPAASALAPAPVSPSGPPHTSVTAPPTDDDSERHNRQQALLQSLFMGPAAGPVTPPGAVTLRPQATASPASGMISPMPPMPPSQSGWQPPRPSMLSHQNGSPSRAPPQTPPQLGRTGPPAHLFTSPAPMHLSPQQVPRQPQAYPQSPPRPPVNNHQRALLGTLFNNTRPPMQGGFNSPPGPPTQGPPGMNIPPMNGMQGRPPNGPPPNGPYNQFAQFSGMPPPDQYSSQFFNPGYPPMGPGGPGGPGSHMPPPPPGMMRPPPGMPGPPGPGGPPGLSAPPQQQQQQPPQPQPSLQMPQPTIRQVSPAAAPPPAPAAAPAMPAHPAPQPQPLAPGAAVHQPVPRPPVGGGLLGLINGTT